MARPRRALHRAFARYLADNRSRFAIAVLPGRRTDAVWSFAFAGITPLIKGWINTFEVTIAVVGEDDRCWDLILDLCAEPVRVEGGYVCRLCERKAIFPSREALWIDHLFSPLLDWVNDELALSPWLALEGTIAGSSAARLCRDRGLDADHGRWLVRHVPVRCVACVAARSD